GDDGDGRDRGLFMRSLGGSHVGPPVTVPAHSSRANAGDDQGPDNGRRAVNRLLAALAPSVVLTSAAVARGDLLALGSPRDGGPVEGGAWMSSGPTDAAG